MRRSAIVDDDDEGANFYTAPVKSYVLTDPRCLDFTRGTIEEGASRVSPAPARKTLFWSLCDAQEYGDLPAGAAVAESLAKQFGSSASDVEKQLVQDAAAMNVPSAYVPSGVIAERAKTDLTKFRRRLQSVQQNLGQG